MVSKPLSGIVGAALSADTEAPIEPAARLVSRAGWVNHEIASRHGRACPGHPMGTIDSRGREK
jgi:hypothetical protein